LQVSLDLISISFSGIQAPSLLWRGLGLFQTKIVFGQDLFRQSGHTKLYIVLWIRSLCMTVGVGWITFFVILLFLVGVSVLDSWHCAWHRLICWTCVQFGCDDSIARTHVKACNMSFSGIVQSSGMQDHSENAWLRSKFYWIGGTVGCPSMWNIPPVGNIWKQS
jgi:hypothetical protein